MADTHIKLLHRLFDSELAESKVYDQYNQTSSAVTATNLVRCH